MNLIFGPEVKEAQDRWQQSKKATQSNTVADPDPDPPANGQWTIRYAPGSLPSPRLPAGAEIELSMPLASPPSLRCLCEYTMNNEI